MPDNNYPHNLEMRIIMSDAIANIDGKDLFASHREPAWHGKGTIFTDEILSISAALDMVPTLRDRTVTLEPVFLPGEVIGMDETGEPYSGQGEPVTGAFCSVSNWADGTTSQYGMVGGRYGVIQDAEALSPFDGFRVETLGALYDGRKTFASYAVDHETVLDPSGVADVVRMYGLAVNSHDGTSPVTWATTPVRVVCQNTLNMAMGRLSNVRKVRHTRTAADRLSEYAATYKASLAYIDEFDKAAKELFAASFSDKQFTNVFNTLFPEPEVTAKGALTRWESKRDLYMTAWNGTPNAGIKGTAWGAVNALTEANQWGRNVRDTDRGADSFISAGMGLDGPTNTFRQGALALVKSRAGIK
jgi:phage/plasmid-like protein (TIGR03299 family)